MRIVLCLVMCLSACMVTLGQEQAQETVRSWKSRSDNVLVRGKFWRVEGGMLEIRPESSPKIERIDIREVCPADLLYLLRENGGVIQRTVNLLRSGYLMDHNENIIARSTKHKKVAGTVDSIVSEGIALISADGRTIALKCDTSRLRKGKRFEGYVRKLKDKIALPSGESTYFYKGYVAFKNEKSLRRTIRSNPVPFLKHLKGHSPAYVVWRQSQKQLERIEEKEEIAEAKADQRVEKHREAVKKRQKERDEKVKINLQAKIDNYENKIKELEGNISGWKLKKSRAKLYSSRWKNMRTKINNAETEIRRLKKAIRDTEKQIDE